MIPVVARRALEVGRGEVRMALAESPAAAFSEAGIAERSEFLVSAEREVWKTESGKVSLD